MRWEELKKRITIHVDALPADEFNQLRCNAQSESKTVEQWLDNCDIRLVANLREHARPAFPKTMRRGTLWCDIDDKGWFVTTKDPRRWSRA
jgi:hypothetical protein